MGSGHVSVGKGVDSDSRGPQFESSRLTKNILSVCCQQYWRDENKDKRGREQPIKKQLV